MPCAKAGNSELSLTAWSKSAQKEAGGVLLQPPVNNNGARPLRHPLPGGIRTSHRRWQSRP
jgi:hypothetical protein